MTAEFKNNRTGTFVNMIESRNRMAPEMVYTLWIQIESGTGKRTAERLQAWREAFNYCVANGRGEYLAHLERRLIDAEKAAA